jgi:hypothetical protein
MRTRYALTSFLLLAASSFFGTPSRADLPGNAYQFDRYSENGKVYFKSIPFDNFEYTDKGEATVYDAEKKKVLYRVGTYIPVKSFIGNSGKTIVTVVDWMSRKFDLDEQSIVRVYVEGKESHSFYLKDLFTCRWSLEKSISRVYWLDTLFVRDDVLNVVTLQGRIVRVSLETGKIIGTARKGKCEECKGTPEPKLVMYHNDDYPPRYGFPELKNGTSFHEALVSVLGKKETGDYSGCKYFIRLQGEINDRGTCRIVSLDARTDGKDDVTMQRKVAAWVTKQRYKTDLIPRNSEKRVFNDFFYLK